MQEFQAEFLQQRAILHQFIQKKDVAGVRNILNTELFNAYWYELGTKFDYHFSTIQFALHSGNAEILKLVLCAVPAGFKPDVNNVYYCAVPYYSAGCQAPQFLQNGLLHEALRLEHLDIVRMLLNAQQEIGSYWDANVNLIGWNMQLGCYEFPLSIAVRAYHSICVSDDENRQTLLLQWLDIIKIIRRRCTHKQAMDDAFLYCWQNQLNEVSQLFFEFLNER